MDRIPRVEMEKRKVTFLSLIIRHSGSIEDGAQISRAQIMEEMEVSVMQLRWLVRILLEDGLIEVLPQYLPNGGQIESIYRSTPAGREFYLSERARQDAANK